MTDEFIRILVHIWQLVMSVLTAVAIAFVRLDLYHYDQQNVDHR